MDGETDHVAFRTGQIVRAVKDYQPRWAGYISLSSGEMLRLDTVLSTKLLLCTKENGERGHVISFSIIPVSDSCENVALVLQRLTCSDSNDFVMEPGSVITLTSTCGASWSGTNREGRLFTFSSSHVRQLFPAAAAAPAPPCNPHSPLTINGRRDAVTVPLPFSKSESWKSDSGTNCGTLDRSDSPQLTALHRQWSMSSVLGGDAPTSAHEPEGPADPSSSRPYSLVFLDDPGVLDTNSPQKLLLFPKPKERLGASWQAQPRIHPSRSPEQESTSAEVKTKPSDPGFGQTGKSPALPSRPPPPTLPKNLKPRYLTPEVPGPSSQTLSRSASVTEPPADISIPLRRSFTSKSTLMDMTTVPAPPGCSVLGSREDRAGDTLHSPTATPNRNVSLAGSRSAACLGQSQMKQTLESSCDSVDSDSLRHSSQQEPGGSLSMPPCAASKEPPLSSSETVSPLAKEPEDVVSRPRLRRGLFSRLRLKTQVSTRTEEDTIGSLAEPQSGLFSLSIGKKLSKPETNAPALPPPSAAVVPQNDSGNLATETVPDTRDDQVSQAIASVTGGGGPCATDVSAEVQQLPADDSLYDTEPSVNHTLSNCSGDFGSSADASSVDSSGDTEKIFERRSRMIQEIISSEGDYLSSIKFGTEKVIPALMTLQAVAPLCDYLFGNMASLIPISQALLEDLKLGLNTNDEVHMAEAFTIHSPSMRSAYSLYCNNYNIASNEMEQLLSDSEGSLAITKALEPLDVQTPVFYLTSLILKPVQRILKYHLLLTKIAENCGQNPELQANWTKAANVMTSVSADINECRRRKDLVTKYKNLGRGTISWSTVIKKTGRINQKMAHLTGNKVLDENRTVLELEKELRSVERAVKNFLKALPKHLETLQTFLLSLESTGKAAYELTKLQSTVSYTDNLNSTILNTVFVNHVSYL